MRILVLGHTGMLGNAVERYFKNKNYSVEIINELRWETTDFKKRILDSDADLIINCIGAIPQQKPFNDYYHTLNVRLPIFLEISGKMVLHPSTDCVFSGKKSDGYKKDDEMDATDPYGKSKSIIDGMISNGFLATKILRTSIIGHELHSSYSLLDWFLNNPNDAVLNGYSNYFWNGITTLQWCKVAEKIINRWNETPTLTQVGSVGLSKYELLKLMGKVYGKSNQINEFFMEKPSNKILVTDFEMPTIEKQLQELKEFYDR